MRAPFLIVGAALLLAAAGDARPRPAGAALPAAIEASVTGCGTGWSHPHAGEQVLTLRNDGATAADVRLIDPATGAVYAEVEGMGPGVTRQVRLALGGGTYSFRCGDDAGGDPVTGPRTRIGGPPGGSAGIVPVSGNDLYAPAKAYTKYVSAGLDRLVARTETLRKAVDAGDLDAARSAWTPAHVLRAARRGVRDVRRRRRRDQRRARRAAGRRARPRLHRVPPRGVRPVARRVRPRRCAGRRPARPRRARAARTAARDQRMDPADLGLRAHEILENTAAVPS